MSCKNNMFERFPKAEWVWSAKAKAQIDVCLICLVDCSFIAPQERIAIENAPCNIKTFGFFHRFDRRGALYEYNELTYFLAASVLHNCEIHFDFQNGCEPAAEGPCKSA